MPKASTIKLIRWWCHQGEDNFAPHITEDFIYDDGLETVGCEDFLLMRAGSGAMNDIKIVDIQCGVGADTIMFEVTDTITELRHRICWIVVYDGENFIRVVACSGIVPKPENKSL